MFYNQNKFQSNERKCVGKVVNLREVNKGSFNVWFKIKEVRIQKIGLDF